jgi:hypothetical protein
MTITVTNQNCVHEEITSRLNAGNACCHTVQSVLLSRLLSKNLRIQTYIILPVVQHGYETWSFTRREEQRLRVFENRVLRRTFGPKKNEVAGGWRRLHKEELHNLYASPNIIRVIGSRRVRWARHIARMGETKMHTVFRLESQRGRDHSDDLGVDGKVILEWILGIVWTEWICPAIGATELPVSIKGREFLD